MDEADDFGGRSRRPSLREQNEVIGRLSRLQADPMRFDYGDQQVSDYTDRQFERVYAGSSDTPVRSDFERVTPSADSSDLVLAGSVGAGGDNRPPDVFKTAKLLHNAGGFEFAPGIEPVGEATPRFQRALAEFQIDNDLKIDGLVNPGGPTLHALGRDALGPADGRPPSLAAAEFVDRFAKPADRTESGRPIFAPVSDTVTPPKIEDDAIQIAQVRIRPSPIPPSGKPRNPGGNKSRGEKILEEIKKIIDSIPPIPDFGEGGKPSPKPAMVIQYPDGRVYLLVTKERMFITGEKPGYVRIQKAEPNWPLRLKDLQRINKNLPDFEDRRTFEQRRAAGEEEYVRGPVFNKHGVIVGYTPLVDPRTRWGSPSHSDLETGRKFFGKPQLLRAPGRYINLTLKQIREMGLWSWYSTDNKPVMKGPMVE